MKFDIQRDDINCIVMARVNIVYATMLVYYLNSLLYRECVRIKN